MHSGDIDGLLAALELARRQPPEPTILLELLTALDRAKILDIDRLARFHDALLFFCAYPASARIQKRAEAILKRFGSRMTTLGRRGDFNPLLNPEISGIAGTSVKVVFSYELVRWLAGRFPGEVAIDWEEEIDPERLAAVLPLLIPFLEEEASVDANVDYLTWLRASGADKKDGGLAWLLMRFAQLPLAPRERAALYDSLGLWIHWKIASSSASRTLMRRTPRTIFYQQTAPLGRREVSIAGELASSRIPITRLARQEGEGVLGMARAALATRYREFYCFNHGDPATILSAHCGRGLEILLIGIRPEMRLPLRAGFAHLMFRNGVLVGYGDGFGLCERMELSLNIFQAFRDGESAYCLARLLTLYLQQCGSSSFSIDPYQIGMENEEAIESGAFWFYRKLGFRCTDPAIERMARREEARVAKTPGHRTSAGMLRKLARGSLLWHISPGAMEWDRFHIRNIGLAVQKLFARDGQNTREVETSALERVATSLRLEARSLSPLGRGALARLAPVLAAIPDLSRWSAEERAGVVAIVRAKSARREQTFLNLLNRHKRLRRALIELGSSSRKR